MQKYVYRTLKQIENDERFPFTRNEIYRLVRKRRENGLDLALRRIGRKWLVREDLFVSWLDASGKGEMDAV